MKSNRNKIQAQEEENDQIDPAGNFPLLQEHVASLGKHRFDPSIKCDYIIMSMAGKSIWDELHEKLGFPSYKTVRRMNIINLFLFVIILFLKYLFYFHPISHTSHLFFFILFLLYLICFLLFSIFYMCLISFYLICISLFSFISCCFGFFLF